MLSSVCTPVRCPMFYRYLIKISLCHVVSKLSPLLRPILLWSVRRTVRYSSASTTAPPSSPIWFTWWSFTSLTEECCPASSNTHAPLWPCDTPPPKPFFAHLSPWDPPPSPSVPFTPSLTNAVGVEEMEKSYVLFCGCEQLCRSRDWKSMSPSG